MDKFIVYCTTCRINNKIYIGVHKTTNPEIFDNYVGDGVYITQPSTYKYGKTIFQRAVNKYGVKNFIRKVLAVFDDEDDAYSLEADIVNEEFLKRSDVYNMVLGGNGGDRGLNAKPCYQYTLNGEYIRSFSNRQEASRFVNKGFTTIKRAIKEKIKAGDWYWSEEKVDKLDLSLYKTTTNRIPVFQYSITGEYDCCYESISDAARCNNTSISELRKAYLLGIALNNKQFSLEFSLQFSTAKLEQLKQSKVYLYKVTGEFIKEFNNSKALGKYLNTKSDLFKYIRLGKVFKDKYQFSFEKVPSLPDRSIKRPASRKIAQYDLQGNLVQTFNTISECVKIYGTGVKHCLSGRNHQSKGYTYKYID